MQRVQSIGAISGLLLWGMVHAFQLEHVVAHHLMPMGHEGQCHHHPDHIPLSSEDWARGGITSDEGCPICDWMGVPAIHVPGWNGSLVISDWPEQWSIGYTLDRVGSLQLLAGLGWRGPPCGRTC